MSGLTPTKLAKLRAVLGAIPAHIQDNLILTAESIDPALARLILIGSKDPDEIARDRFFVPLAPLSGDPAFSRPSVCFAPPRTLDAIWDWISRVLDPESADEIRAIAVDLDRTDDPGQLDPVRVIVAEKILKSLHDVMEDAKAEKKLKLRLGVADFRAVHDIAEILLVSPILREALEDLPEAIEEISEDLSMNIRDRYEKAEEHHSGAGTWFLYFVMARLTKPWRILGTFEKIGHREDDFLLSRTDMATIGDAILLDAEHHVEGFSTPPSTKDEATSAARALQEFAAITVGMTREIGIRKDGGWGKKIIELRSTAASQMEAIHARARKVFKPVLVKPLSGGSRLPDPAPSQGSVRFEEALAMARFLYLTKDDASRAAVGGAHSQLLSETRDGFRQIGSALLDQIRGGHVESELPPEQRIEDVTLLLIELGAEDEASLLMRRVAALQAA